MSIYLWMEDLRRQSTSSKFSIFYYVFKNILKICISYYLEKNNYNYCMNVIEQKLPIIDIMVITAI